MNEIKEMTAPDTSVGADEGQPLNQAESSIADGEEDYKEILRRMKEELRYADGSHFRTFTMNDLYDQTFADRPPIIDGLLPSGTCFLAGAPKVGKSFLVAQFAYHVSTGRPIWGYPVRRGGVLYLALEDDQRRLQERMSRMFGVEGTDDLNFAICSGQVGAGLETQLDNYLREHPNTRLVIIDTLQKVRATQGEAYSYARDYDVIGQLKHITESRGVGLILVHHTRKQPASDVFKTISGTTGLLGCADGAFILKKEKRTDLAATLEIVSRDQPDQLLHLIRNEAALTWELDHAETQPWTAPPDPLLEKVAALVMADKSTWTGSATELLALLGEDMKPNILTRRLNVKSGELRNEYGIALTVSHNRNGSCISLGRPEQEV